MDFLKELIEKITEPATLSIILACFAVLLLVAIILLIVYAVKIKHVKDVLHEHLYDTKIAAGIEEFEKISEPECKCGCNKPVEETKTEETPAEEPDETFTAVILEPSVLPEDVLNEQEEKVEEKPVKKEVVKRNTNGMMKWSFAQLSDIIRYLGTDKSWKNKTEIVDAIKLIIKSKKCTKIHILQVLGLDFLSVKLTEEETKGLKSKTKDELLILLESVLRR